mgnify:FL=1
MRKLSLLFAFFISLNLFAQDAVNYQLPPKDIMDLALAKPTPTVSVDSKGQWMLLIERNMYPLVDELGQPEVRVAGLRINPANFSQSRQNYINNFTLKNIASGKEYKISGLPANLLGNSVAWSRNDKKIAFTHSSGSTVDLYVIDVATQKAMKVNKTSLNVVLGGAFSWLDDNTLLYKIIVKPASAMPKRPITPPGPTVQESYGKAAPRPTYQDMIKSPYDELLFEFFTRASELHFIGPIEVLTTTLH